MRLGVTRPADQLADFVKRAAACGIEVVPLPLTITRAVPFQWPPLSCHGNPDWVFFTSGNAVRSFFDHLIKLGQSLNLDSKIGVNGAKTSQSLQPYNRQADFVPSKPYAKQLFEEFAANPATGGKNIVYARAAVVSYEPGPLLRDGNIHLHEVVCYETVAQRIEPGVVSQLTEADGILFTAPSSVKAYHEQFGNPLVRPIALGRSTASAMDRVSWRGTTILRQPHIESVLELLS